MSYMIWFMICDMLSHVLLRLCRHCNHRHPPCLSCTTLSRVSSMTSNVLKYTRDTFLWVHLSFLPPVPRASRWAAWACSCLAKANVLGTVVQLNCNRYQVNQQDELISLQNTWLTGQVIASGRLPAEASPSHYQAMSAWDRGSELTVSSLKTT